MSLAFWQGKKCLLVHYKDKLILAFDVDLDTYHMIDLYFDVKKLAIEQGISFLYLLGLIGTHIGRQIRGGHLGVIKIG